jgi:AraC-like DNA-binding protein
MKGFGSFLINNKSIDYDTDSLFLLTPGDEYSFRISTPTTFCMITFSEILITGKGQAESDQPDLTEIFRKIEMTFYQLGKNQFSLEYTSVDKSFIRLLFDRLVMEIDNKEIFGSQIKHALILLVLNFTVRNLQSRLIEASISRSVKSLVSGIINYIQENIGNNKKLYIGRMSKHFGKSKSALQVNFKKATKATIRDFIIEARLQMAAARLLYTRMTASEIAGKFGYHDESHLNKSFREKYGVSPIMYRQKERMKP